MPIEKSALHDIIAEHWDKLKRQKVEVPEWKTTVHFDPLTIAERDRLRESASNEYAVDTVILKAQDEEGKRLFTVADKPQLMNAASGAIIGRIAGRILSADLIDVDRLGEH